MQLTFFKKLTYGALALFSLVMLILAGRLFENNAAGYVQVKQAAGSGEMSVRLQPGIYPQMFADIHEYKISDVYDFNGGDEQITVRFNDAATAKISGQVKYKLPLAEDKILSIHQDFRSDTALHSDLVRQVVASALKQTATLFGAEEVYSTRRSEFINLINEQIKSGIYATYYTESWGKDEDGNSFVKRNVNIKTAQDGKPIIAEQSAFARYNIELIQLVVNDIEFDEKTQELIAERKKADQQKVVAKANAEKAKQDAITAEEQGKAAVAEAEAKALVEKKTAVVAAEKEKEVAAQDALRAEENKKAIIARGQAEAEAARLKVAAGLTPLEKATIDKETAIGVAEKLSQVKLPATMVIGGGNGSAPLDPFTAVGLDSFMKISKRIADVDKAPN